MFTNLRQLASILLVTFAGSLAMGCAAPDAESDDEASEASEVDNVEGDDGEVATSEDALRELGCSRWKTAILKDTRGVRRSFTIRGCLQQNVKTGSLIRVRGDVRWGSAAATTNYNDGTAFLCYPERNSGGPMLYDGVVSLKKLGKASGSKTVYTEWYDLKRRKEPLNGWYAACYIEDSVEGHIAMKVTSPPANVN